MTVQISDSLLKSPPGLQNR